MSDIYNEWASKSELEKYVRQFFPGAHPWEIAALELVQKFSRMFLCRPIHAFYMLRAAWRSKWTRHTLPVLGRCLVQILFVPIEKWEQ